MVLGCAQDGGEGAVSEAKCEGFEPIRLQVTEDLFEPDSQPYLAWVWNERRTCGYGYLVRPSLGTAGGGTCVLELSEAPADWPFRDRLIILPKVIAGSCTDFGEQLQTGVEPPIGAVVLN